MTPRIELVLGVPSISRHMGVTAGAALRPTALSKDLEYQPFWEADNKGRHLEYGLGLKCIF